MIPGNGGCSQNAQTSTGRSRRTRAFISPPPDNTNLLAYAQSDGKRLLGTHADRAEREHGPVTVNGGTTDASSLTADPIIYVTNRLGCSATYSPYNVSYPTIRPRGCGNVYVIRHLQRVGDDRRGQRHHHQRATSPPTSRAPR